MTEPDPEVKKEDGDNTEKTRSRPQYHQSQNSNQYQGGKWQSDRITTPKATFKGGWMPQLEGAYLDLSTGYRADIYKTSIRIMRGYAAKNYDNGDDIIMIPNDLKMPTLENPKALDSMADDVDK